MPRCLLVVPTGSGVGLTSVSLGIVRALDRQGVTTGFVRPVSVRRGPDPSGALLEAVAHVTPPPSIARDEAEALLADNADDQLLERVVSMVEEAGRDASVVVVEGCVPVPGVAYATRLNVAMAAALDAELVVVGMGNGAPHDVARAFDVACSPYAGRTIACVVNRVPVEGMEQPGPRAVVGGGRRLVPDAVRATWEQAFVDAGLALVAVVPRLDVLGRPSVAHIARALDMRFVNPGATDRRVASVAVCAASLGHAVGFFVPGLLAVVPADRDDILAGLALATLGGLELAGIVISLDIPVRPGVLALCAPAFETGLPVLLSGRDSYTTATAIHGLAAELGPEDGPLAELAMGVVADHLRYAWVRAQAEDVRERRMTTAAFRYTLLRRAREADRRIVLPEGDEPRTLRAAAICAERGIARCVLLGDPEVVRKAARTAGIELPGGVEIVAPEAVYAQYIEGMLARRAHRGLARTQAADQLRDRVVLGTMMVAEGHADGLVSGAVHSTAHTIRPALQLIRTAPGASLVSSVFFMCLPEQVLVYGDCAVNPDPTASELAEIAIQCAESAVAFGIHPRVAMISYSTHGSGEGADVEKVEEATRLARERRPELLIDGPLQYDAAAIASVGASKAPDSPV
ncbi:MAG: phosphate acetyltransferase, partial [Alphaproteobacteria bacterium]|nr:phosphate acetyltransferase [Alphaproteobacteria bacterium]